MSFELSPQMRIVALVGVVLVLVAGGGTFVLGHKKDAQPDEPLLSASVLVKRAHAARPELAPKKAAHQAAAKPRAAASAKAKAKAPATPATQPKAVVKPKPKPASASVKESSLYQNLPGAVIAALQRSKLVVAVVYNPDAPDDQIAHDDAEAGARAVGAGFVALNVLVQDDVGQLTRTYGLLQDPSVLVFRRPGVVIARLNGYADSASVAQAVAENAPDDVGAAPARAVPAP